MLYLGYRSGGLPCRLCQVSGCYFAVHMLFCLSLSFCFDNDFLFF